MSNHADRNSLAAAEYAAKKKEQLRKANALRLEREANSRSNDAGQTMIQRGSFGSFQNGDERELVGRTTSHPNAITTSFGQLEVQSQSYGPHTERIIIRKAAPKDAAPLRKQLLGDGRGASSLSSMYAALENNHYDDDDNDYKGNSSNRTSYKKESIGGDYMVQPMGLRGENKGGFGPSQGGSSFFGRRSGDACVFFHAPIDPSGERYDLSDRPLLCASQSSTGECIFGGSDHALYAVPVGLDNSSTGSGVRGGMATKKRTITMYSKRYGHTDWVTSVTHLTDGRVLSAAMDSKICLWDASRTTCIDLLAHSKPVARVVAHPLDNTALSCGYDATMCLWSFGNQPAPSKPSGMTNRNSSSSRSSSSTGYSPSVVFSSQRDDNPIVECTYMGGNYACGDRVGGVMIWDAMNPTQPMLSVRGHRGSITAMLSAGESGTLLLTSGVDGMVRGWDTRTGGGGGTTTKPCFEIPAHAGLVAPSSSSSAMTKYNPNDSRSVPSKTGGAINKGGGASIAAAAIACMIVPSHTPPDLCTLLLAMPSRGGGDVSMIVTGGADSSVCLCDVRQTGGSSGASGGGGGGGGALSGGMRVVERWSHHRVGMYSLCAAGDSCFFSGDGAGMLHCYDSTVSGDAGLKYGIGASEQGAVRVILKVGDHKVVTGSEDGKALVFRY